MEFDCFDRRGRPPCGLRNLRMNDHRRPSTISNRPVTLLVTVAVAGVLAMVIEPLIVAGFSISGWIAERPLLNTVAAYYLLLLLVQGFWLGFSQKKTRRQHLASYVLFSLGMGGVYFLVEQAGHDCFEFASAPGKVPNILDFLYFSLITVTTVGYGDIVPSHTFVRLLVLLQVLFGLTLLAKFGQDIIDDGDLD